MARKRLRVILEFNEDKEVEKEMWDKLNKFSNSAAYVKDVLNGVMPPLAPIDYIGYPGSICFPRFEEMDEE